MILLNGIEVKPTIFPNGETLINTDTLCITQENTITMKFQGDADVITLIFLAKHIEEVGHSARLIMPYMPYSRMDRTENNKTIFTLKHICSIINDLIFDEVIIYEPHSDVCIALLDRVEVRSVTDLLARSARIEMGFNEETDYIYYPDASAEKHFGKRFNFQSLVGLKSREFETGKITKLDIVGDTSNLKEGFRVVMVDDLCSYGGTFLMGAEKLKEMGAGEISLVVTHCEDSIFKGDILKTDLINNIYTTDSMVRTEENDRIKVIKL